jgi:very-short-patch-repair endonuclease
VGEGWDGGNKFLMVLFTPTFILPHQGGGVRKGILPHQGGGELYLGVRSKWRMSKAKARELRKNMTDAERVLWKHIRLKQLGGYKFRRQQPLGQYVVDFMCFEKRLIVEVDGGQHSEQISYDSKRSQWLKNQGYRLLRFWDNEVLKNTEAVVEVIMKTLEGEGNPPTSILPHKGGGVEL